MSIEQIKMLLMEEEYPFFSDEHLQTMIELYDDINELCYIACTMKAKVDKIKVGPIEIESNAEMWNRLANVYYRKMLKGAKGGTQSLTGICIGRTDGN